MSSRRRSTDRFRMLLAQSPFGTGLQNGAFFTVLTAAALATLVPGTAGAAVALGLVLVAATLWGLRLLLSLQVPIVFSSLGAPVLLATTYVVIRYGLNEVESIARPELLLALGAALAFFVILNNVRHRWQITVLTWVLTGVGLLVALGGLWRIIGLRQQPDLAAVVYLPLVFPITAAGALFSRRSSRARLALFVASLVLGAAAVLSLASSALVGILGAVVVLAFYLIRRGVKQRRWILFTGVLLTAGLLALMVIGRARQQSPAAALAEPAAGPAALWLSAVNIGRQHLWIGGGPGMFRWLYPANRTIQGQPVTVGNDYLQVFADYGLVGLGLLLWCVGAFAVETFQILAVRGQRYSTATPSNRYALAAGGLAALAGVLLLAGWNSILHAPGCLLTLAVILAATLTTGVKHRGEDPDDVGPVGTYNALALKGVSKFVLVGAILVAVTLAGIRLSKTGPATYYRQRGDQARAALRWRDADKAYRQAWALDRFNYETALASGDLHAARSAWAVNQREAAAREAIRWYDRVLTCNPYATDARIAIGRLHDVLGQQPEALEHYQRALQADPRNAAYLAQLGLHHLRRGEQAEALNQFRLAYELGGPDLLPELELQRFDQLAP